MGFFNKVVDFIAKASIPLFKLEGSNLNFKLPNDEIFKYDLGNFDKRSSHDRLVQSSYTLKNENIFMEYVKLLPNADWRGQAYSLFEGVFKEKLNIQIFETSEKKEIGNYIFRTKKVDESFILHTIHVYSADMDVMIVDMKGDLYKSLLQKLDENYNYKYEEEEKGSVNFDISLVRENSIYRYFYVQD